MMSMENDELAEYLNALQREDCYRVDAVVKESPYEVTQRVSFVGENGATRGPFIRKIINRDAGMGSVYERLHAAQQSGRRFKSLPTILECYQRDDALVVVMEFVPGETLQDLVYRLDPSESLARDVFPQLCDAVSELHESFDPPIIHRDLKPSNIIMSRGGCTIIDFGIAREYKDGATQDTAHFGTRSFAPPEQFGFGQTTVRSDVYALGMLLYFCLTEVIPDVSHRDNWYAERQVPEALRAVIAKATAFDPQQRFASAAQLKAAFVLAIDGVGPNGAVAGDVEIPVEPGPPQREARQSQPPTQSKQFQPVAQTGGSSKEQAPHILGRIWNVIVIAAFGALLIAVVYFVATGAFFETGRFDAAPWHGVVVLVCAFLFLAALAFACLDKRRLRLRFPALASVKTWQIWVVVAVLFALASVVNRAM